MGLFEPPPIVYYYLSQEDKRDPYRKQGPYDLETLALMYKEELISHTTLIWTNERIKVRGKIRKQKIPGWNPIGDMPEPWQNIFRPAVTRAPVRTAAQQSDPFTVTPQVPGEGAIEQPPSVPAI